MNERTKETIYFVGALIAAITIPTIGIMVTSHFIDNDRRKKDFKYRELNSKIEAELEKQRKIKMEELKRQAKEHNDFISNELLSIKDWNKELLISRIISNTYVNSSIKSALITALQTGKNEITPELSKQLYITANNDLIDDRDKITIFNQICDGHVPTKEELEIKNNFKMAEIEKEKAIANAKYKAEAASSAASAEKYKAEMKYKTDVEKAKIEAKAAVDKAYINNDTTHRTYTTITTK